MKNIALILSFLSFSLVGFSQTKFIAHKSHSGSAENFQLALNSEDFNPLHSNFGEAPDRFVINAQLDSVIYVDEYHVILVSTYLDPNKVNKTKSEEKSGWEPSRERVYGHPLFSQQHSLDSIKMVLKRDYHFENDIDKVVFIGYDNGENSTEENQIIPISTITPKDNAPRYFFGILLVATLGLVLRGITVSMAKA